MTGPDPKTDLMRYLQAAREALPWKLDGLGEYDVRRPLTPTGTNLLGLVKHVATIDSLTLDAVGHVPWWPPERREVTLHRALVHLIAETHRHAGHADVVRELIDGAVGLRADNPNMPSGDRDWWHDHRARVQRAAEEAGRR